jgi:hypothetical protein
MPNRDLELLASTFEREWVHVHGPPAEVSGDQEFAQGYFQNMLRSHNIAFREQGARRHNKTGVVERGNGVLKVFVKRLVLDIQSQVAGSATIVFTVSESVSQATYFKNMLVGNKMLSAFEQCRGYRPSLCGLHRCMVTPERVAAHDEMVHVEICRARVVSGMSMCYRAANYRRERKFCSISRTLSKRTFRGGKLLILLTRATILQQSGEIGTAEATD